MANQTHNCTHLSPPAKLQLDLSRHFSLHSLTQQLVQQLEVGLLTEREARRGENAGNAWSGRGEWSKWVSCLAARLGLTVQLCDSRAGPPDEVSTVHNNNPGHDSLQAYTVRWGSHLTPLTTILVRGEETAEERQGGCVLARWEHLWSVRQEYQQADTHPRYQSSSPPPHPTISSHLPPTLIGDFSHEKCFRDHHHMVI